jgi:hypothetical protein
MGTGVYRPHVEGEDHRKRGYFAEAVGDRHESRHQRVQREDPDFAAYHKTANLAKAELDQHPPRAQPGETAKVFSGECRPSEYKCGAVDSGDGSTRTKVYFPSKNGEWKTRPEVVHDFRVETDIRHDFQDLIKQDLKRAAAHHQAHQEELIADRKLVSMNPFGKNAVGLKEDLQKYYGVPINSEPLEARQLHPDVPRPMSNIIGFQQEHHSPNKGCVAHADLMDGSRYEPSSSPEFQRQRQKETATVLRDQVEETRALRRAARAIDLKNDDNDHGLVANLAPRRKRKEHYGLSTLITVPTKAQPDTHLGDVLQWQITMEHQRKERDQYAARYEEFKEFDPYFEPESQPSLHLSASCRGCRGCPDCTVVCSKLILLCGCRVSFSRYSEPHQFKKIKDSRRHKPQESGNEIRGTSLVMAKTSHGPTLLPDGSKMYPKAKSVKAREAEAETRAQAEGRSEFGRPGAGNAIRGPNGELHTALYGVIDGEKSGRIFERESEMYQKRQARHREEEQTVLREQSERRAILRAKSRAFDPNVHTSLKIDPPQLIRENGLKSSRRNQQDYEPLGATPVRDRVVIHDPNLKMTLDAQVKERHHMREQEKAALRSSAVPFADRLDSYQTRTPRGRSCPEEYNQQDHSKRSILLQDPEQTERLRYRQDLDADIAARRQRKKELYTRKMREEAAQCEHGPFPGKYYNDSDRGKRDKHGNIHAGRQRMPNDMLTQVMHCDDLV